MIRALPLRLTRSIDRAALAMPALYLVAALLRLIDLSAAQLWYDEAFSVLVASKDLATLMTAVAGDVHPPLYYLLLWPIVHLFGPAAWAVRLPSVLLSLAALWLTNRIALRIGVPAPARWAALIFMAINPLEIHFAQEARMYALLQFLVLAWLLAILERRWKLAALVGALAMYTQNYALLYLPGIALIGLAGEINRPVKLNAENTDYPHLNHWRPGDEVNLKGLLLAVGLPALLWLPWEVVLLGQMTHVATAYWIQPVNLGSLVYCLYMLFWGFYVPGALTPYAALVVIGGSFYSVLALRFRGNAQSTLRIGVLLIMGFLPALLAYGISISWKPILLFRGLIPSAPFLYLLIAAGLISGKQWKAVYTSIMFIPLVLFSLVYYYEYNPSQKGDTLGEIAAVRAAWQPGDVIYHVNDGVMPIWQVYAPDLPQAMLPECPGAQRNLGALSKTTRAALGMPELGIDQLSAKRAWLIWPNAPTSTTCEAERAAAVAGNRLPYLTIRDDAFTRYTITLIEELNVQSR